MHSCTSSHCSLAITYLLVPNFTIPVIDTGNWSGEQDIELRCSLTEYECSAKVRPAKLEIHSLTSFLMRHELWEDEIVYFAKRFGFEVELRRGGMYVDPVTFEPREQFALKFYQIGPARLIEEFKERYGSKNRITDAESIMDTRDKGEHRVEIENA